MTPDARLSQCEALHRSARPQSWIRAAQQYHISPARLALLSAQRTLHRMPATPGGCLRVSIKRVRYMSSAIQLTDDDIAFLINVLRSSGLPLTTQQLIDALRDRSGA